MEFWLAQTYTRCGLAPTYSAATKAGLATYIKELAKLTVEVPEEHREAFTQALHDAGEIADIRNGMLHVG